MRRPLPTRKAIYQKEQEGKRHKVHPNEEKAQSMEGLILRCVSRDVVQLGTTDANRPTSERRRRDGTFWLTKLAPQRHHYVRPLRKVRRIKNLTADMPPIFYSVNTKELANLDYVPNSVFKVKEAPFKMIYQYWYTGE